MSKVAEEWAKHLAKSSKPLRNTPHEKRLGKGENLYMRGAHLKEKELCKSAVNSWYVRCFGFGQVLFVLFEVSERHNTIYALPANSAR